MGNRLIFDGLIASGTTELFRSRGIELRAIEAFDAPVEYAATIGFAADEMRGMLGLGMKPETLAQLAALDRDGHVASEEDWLGEAVNQLSGRVKNKLIRYGVDVSLAIPNVLRGVSLQFRARSTSPLWTYSFESVAGVVCVWLDVRFDDELVLKISANPAQHGAAEGELLLF